VLDALGIRVIVDASVWEGLREIRMLPAASRGYPRFRRRASANGSSEIGEPGRRRHMDDEIEAPLDDLEALNDPDDENLGDGVSGSGGSVRSRGQSEGV
jgi:hypothetical protein